MALVVADRVKETTTTTGTGTYTLAGAVDGFQSFAAIGNGNTCYYACSDGTDYEVGIGTYTASGTTLARTTIIESSNSDAAVNWGAGTKDIFVTLPASKAFIADASGNFNLADNVKIQLGTGSDLQIYHDGANSRIDDTGTGRLVIRGNSDVTIGKYTGENMAIFNADAGVELRYNNSTKFTTSSTGVDVTGNVAVSGTVDGRDVATDGTKLDGIEASADVTDATNVQAAGALMDSEVTNLAQVKAFDSSDYATAAQGTKADNALPKAGGQITGNITMSGAQTVDGRDLSVDGAKLDNIEANATADQTAAEIEAIVNHDNLQGFVSNEHIDWTASGAGTIHATNIPVVALTTVQTAANQTAHLALTAQEGDIVVRSDENKSYVHNGGTAGTMADYTELLTPTDAVLSVNGQTGAVTISNATTSSAGLMSSTDKSKLDGVESGATADQTITAGSGLTGGGTGNVTISHADTSSQASVNGSGRTYIQDITLDTYGHVTGIATATETVTNTDTTNFNIQANSGTQVNISAGEEINFINGNATTAVVTNQTNPTVTFNHNDTSSQASVNNSNGTVIQDVTLDGYGHVTGLASVDLDSRYVNVTGDTMTAPLTIDTNTSGMLRLSATNSSPWAIDLQRDDATNSRVYNGGGFWSFEHEPRYHNGGSFQKLFHDGYHPNADKWTTARTLSLSGDASGSVSWDGSANATLSVAVADDSHNHVWGNIDGASVGGLSGPRFTTASGYIEFGPANTTWAHIYTDRPNFYFNKELYVNNNKVWNAGNDGAGSGLDADTVDGIQASSFLRSDTADSYSSTLDATGDGWYLWSLGARGASSGEYGIGNRNGDSYRQLTFHVPNQAAYSSSGTIPSFGWYSNGAVQLMKLDSDTGNLWVKGSIQRNGNTVWDAGNDGSGSGLDADTLDGVQGSSFARLDANNTFSASYDSYFTSAGNSGSATGASLQAYGDSSNGAYMAFHRTGVYAINMGLDTDNVFRLGGWSASANRLQMDMSGNLTMAGNVTAYSDERLKDNVEVIENAVDKVKAIRGVTYNRNDDENYPRHAGVIAQEVEKVLPEVVSEDSEGIKTVAYGNMVGLLIEAIKEQQKQIDELKAKLEV